MAKRSTRSIALVVFLSASFAHAAPADFMKRLQEADDLAWLTNWYSALPIYEAVEKAATAAGDRRDAMYAKFGRLRGEMQLRPLATISEQVAADLEAPLAMNDPRLRLRGLTAKGDIDLEWDILAAERDWQQVRELAKQLGDNGWENRANGELGMIAFLKGNTGEATTLVKGALESATRSGDVGGQLRYMGAIANGLLLAGYPPLAMGYVDRALKFSSEHPEAGFPFVVYSTKVLTLMTMGQFDEAERFAKTEMAQAQSGDHRIKEIELSMMLAQIADKRGQKDQAVTYLEQAARLARAGHVQRLLSDAEESLARTYRARGDLSRAREHAVTAVKDTELTGSRFTLPMRVGILADIEAAQGRVIQADRVYDQASDIVEGIMVNVPSREAEARLIAVMSDLYAGQFRLVADRLKNPVKAFQVIERARGRALADMLRTVPNGGSESPARAAQTSAISRLQVRLMKVSAPAQRAQLLDQLWDAEQRLTLDRAKPRLDPAVARSRVPVASIQRQLKVGEVLLEYVLVAPHSYCLAITRSSFKLVPLPARAEVERLADRFAAAIRDGTGDVQTARSALYDAVLQPVVSVRDARRVFVVPDGKLHLVPFDLLMNGAGKQERIVAAVPSANVFFLLRTRVPDTVPTRPLLAVGGVPYDQMFATPALTVAARRSDDGGGFFDAAYPAKLSVLASAKAEVLAAARLLGSNSVVLTGAQATESALKAEKLGTFEILHFAVHAFADPKFPERAALVLLNDSATGEDGLLQPKEIGGLKLNARVVVLSACDTSVGPTLGQEGVLNIARAFLLAGARSVITTLWAVSDATSTALMREFYENLTAGANVDEALARSKEAVIDRFGSDALPTVAAFQMVGIGDHRIQVNNRAQKTASGGH